MGLLTLEEYYLNSTHKPWRFDPEQGLDHYRKHHPLYFENAQRDRKESYSVYRGVLLTTSTEPDGSGKRTRLSLSVREYGSKRNDYFWRRTNVNRVAAFVTVPEAKAAVDKILAMRCFGEYISFIVQVSKPLGVAAQEAALSSKTYRHLFDYGESICPVCNNKSVLEGERDHEHGQVTPSQCAACHWDDEWRPDHRRYNHEQLAKLWELQIDGYESPVVATTA